MDSNSDAATYMKRQLELEEKNPNRSQRTIYWRERPIHTFARPPLLRPLATNSTLTYWGIQIGEDYVWELEVQDGKVGYHLGFWLVPEKQGVPFVRTEHDREAVGQTRMTDFEIKAKGSAL